MKRRDFLISAGAAAFAAASNGFGASSADDEKRIRQYLRSIMPTAERVEQFTRIWKDEAESMEKSNGWTYDAELGWVHCASVHDNGVGRTKTFYHYEADGARKVINCVDSPCRIHAYGDSFTHCDQVCDNQTWTEYAAGHIQEPIRNYGVGGYGVYQAYRRMLKVEKTSRADYIILNIWDDDHYRSLDAWRSIRFGRGSACGFTLPHVRVDVKAGTCQQKENLITRRQDVIKLRDEDFIFEAFKDDPVLKMIMATRAGRNITKTAAAPVAVSFGIGDDQIGDADVGAAIRKIHTRAALFASRNIVTWTEQFIRETGRKLMVVLSFGAGNIASELRGKSRFDQDFCDWLADKPYPVLDMRDEFKRDFANSKLSVEKYLNHFYNGHHSPAGNFFFAGAVRDKLVQWLNPKPSPWR